MGLTEPDRPELAAAYELALELEAAGLGPADLAERLGIPEAAVANLLAVAHAKSRPTGGAQSSLQEARP